MKKPSKFPRLREFAATAAAIALLISVGLGGAALIKSGFTFGPSDIAGTEPNIVLPSETIGTGCELPLLTPDPVDGVYVTCQDYDFTIYANMTDCPWFEFCILSEEALPEGFEITLPGVESEYKVTVTQATDAQLSAANTGISKIYSLFVNDAQWRDRLIQRVLKEQELYSAYAEMAGDFESLQAYKDSLHLLTKEDMALYEAFTALQDSYFTFRDALENDLKQAQMPQVKTVPALYSVKIEFTNVEKEERIGSVLLTTGEKTRIFPIRNLRVARGAFEKWMFQQSQNINSYLVPTVPNPYISSFYLDGYYPQRAEGSDWAHATPFRGGSTEIHRYFVAQTDLEITDITVYGNNKNCFQVLGAEYIISKPDCIIETTKWTPESVIGTRTIPKGSKVTVVIYCKDLNTTNFNYAMNCQLFLEYGVPGESNGVVTASVVDVADVYLYRNPMLHASQLYQWVYEKKGVADYYHNYYNPFLTLSADLLKSGIVEVKDPPVEVVLEAKGEVVEIGEKAVRLALKDPYDVKEFGGDIWLIYEDPQTLPLRTVVTFTYTQETVQKTDDGSVLFTVFPISVQKIEQTLPPPQS